jgi:DNA-binding response OmpR family regulator
MNAFRQAAVGHSEGAHVYVVDDEEVIATTLAEILRMSGFKADCFFEGAPALAAARLAPPDLLISDVMMPGLTGIELAIKFKEDCSHCRVLLFSGQADTMDLMEKARSQGHDFELIPKPVHPHALLAKATELTNGRRAQK